MSQPHLEHYLPEGMATTEEYEVRMAILESARRFVHRLEAGPLTCCELEAAARPLVGLIEQGRTLLDRFENAQDLLRSFRERCAAFAPASPDDADDDESFSPTQ